MSELKPCPFCGNELPVHYTVMQNQRVQLISCPDCNATVVSMRFQSGKDALAIWNARPIEDELQKRIAELETFVKGHDPFEEFPPKERGTECSVMVLGMFEYEDEFTPFTNWDLCVYWYDEERWHPLNGYVEGDDIVRWWKLPEAQR